MPDRLGLAGLVLGLMLVCFLSAGFGFLAQMFVRGVLVVASSQRQDIVKLYPPLILEDEQVDLFLEAAESSLEALPG